LKYQDWPNIVQSLLVILRKMLNCWQPSNNLKGFSAQVEKVRIQRTISSSRIY